MEIVLDKLKKEFGRFVAVDGLDLKIDDGEFVALLGPSGCGKTTTLLAIAGIYQLTGGRVLFDGREVNRLLPRERNLGMVFQSYALYPHMSAYENIVFPLRLAKVPEKERRGRANKIAEMMDIADLMDRKPDQLSGGQQQRVALGRALVKEPDALLFDEPLSNLDARLRLTMRTEIKRLLAELGITSIFVTHDQIEAMTMADRIAIINRGKLESYGSPDDTYDRPKTRFVAGFVGNPPMNFLDVEVIREKGSFLARRSGLEILVSPERAEKAAAYGGTVTMGIRPEDTTVGGEGIRGEVIDVEPLGRESLVVMEVGGVRIHALVHVSAPVKIGDHTTLSFNPEKAQFFDHDSGRSLLWN